MPALQRLPRLTDLDVTDHQAVIGFCGRNAIDLVVVGPEAPLVAGLVDDLEAAGIKAFGPTKAAAQLEGLQGLHKGRLRRSRHSDGSLRHDLTMRTTLLPMCVHKGAPIVVKADGLAAGKGVVVAMTVEEAEAAVAACFEGLLRGSGR